MLVVTQSPNSSIPGFTRAELAGLLKPVQLRRVGLALCLCGAAGMGKSHNAKILTRESGLRSCLVQATASFSEVVRALPLPRKLPSWAQRLPEQLRAGLHLESAQATELMAVLLQEAAPIILQLEDLHEVNNKRLNFWLNLATVVKSLKGVALLATSRIQAPEPFLIHQIEPLLKDQVRGLLEVELGASLPIEALEWVQARAAGNPLFSLEYFRALARSGFLWTDLHQWRWSAPDADILPSSVEALIARSMLTATSSPLLETALAARAVLGRGVISNKLWAEVANISETDVSLARLEFERHGILLRGDFAHPLFQEVALGNLALTQHRLMAGRALRALEADQPEVAAELIDAASLEANQAFELLNRAATLAEQRGDLARAARLLARGLDFAPNEERGLLAFEVANRLEPFDLQGAIALMEQAVQLKPNNLEACYSLILSLGRSGRIDQARQVFETLPESERLGQRGWEAQLFLQYREGHDAKVSQIWHEQLQSSTQLDASSLVYLTDAISNTGNTSQAIEIAANALKRPNLSPKQRGQLLEVCGMFQFRHSNYLEAHKLLTQECELLKTHGLAYRTRNALIWRAMSAQELGWFERAIPDLQEAVLLAANAGNTESLAYAQMSLGVQQLELGQYEQAEETLLEVDKLLQRFSYTFSRVSCDLGLCEFYLEAPSHRGVLALRHGYTALERARRLESPPLLNEALFFASLAEARFGNIERALTLSEEALTQAQNDSEPQSKYKAL